MEERIDRVEEKRRETPQKEKEKKNEGDPRKNAESAKKIMRNQTQQNFPLVKKKRGHLEYWFSDVNRHPVFEIRHAFSKGEKLSFEAIPFNRARIPENVIK